MKENFTEMSLHPIWQYMWSFKHVWASSSCTVVCQSETTRTCITDHSATGLTTRWLFFLTQVEGGIAQTVSLVGVSAVAQQQLHCGHKKKTFETRKYNCSKMQCTMKGSVGSTIAAIENNNGTKEELDLWLKFKCGKCMTAWLISSLFCDATAGWTVARMVAYTPNLQTAWCSLSNHPAALYIISHDTVITFLSPTYQCSHCHCRKRNGGLSFPCHRLHRGRCHLAGAFGLEEHSFY